MKYHIYPPLSLVLLIQNNKSDLFIGTLIIQDAWNEPTSKYPKGKFGNSSLFYEGRAATIGLSFSGTDEATEVVIDSVSDNVHRLKQLATCAGMFMVENSLQYGTLHVCSEETNYRRKKRPVMDLVGDEIRDKERTFRDLVNGKLIVGCNVSVIA